MSEFTDGTAKGKTLSMVDLEQRLEALTTAVNALKSENEELKKPKLLVKQYEFTPKKTNPVCTISAPDVAGYHFVCWVRTWTDGSIELVYPEGYTQNNIKCWSTNPEAVAGTGCKVDGIALYERDY